MHRVTKINGTYTVITYGSPDMRLALFLECLPKNKYELQIKEIPLSFLSNLINSLRSKSKNSTLKGALQDKKVLLSSFIDGIQLFKF